MLVIVVVAPQMHAVRAGAKRKLDVVIHNQDCAMVFTNREQRFDFAARFLTANPLLAVLQDNRPAAQGCRRSVEQFACRIGPIRGNRIKPF